MMSYKLLYFPKLTRRSKYISHNNYKDYRDEIRVDCKGRCVYCDIHENELGGPEYMTLDHFRPKDTHRHLECDPTNLMWACSKCNGYKRNTWPAIATPHTVVGKRGFIDPFMENMSDYFDISPDGRLIALKVPAEFIIKTLKLNRTGARKTREKRNKTYESRQKTEAFFVQSIKHMEALLKNPALPKELKKQIFQHKESLQQEHELMKQSSGLDFNLY